MFTLDKTLMFYTCTFEFTSFQRIQSKVRFFVNKTAFHVRKKQTTNQLTYYKSLRSLLQRQSSLVSRSSSFPVQPCLWSGSTIVNKTNVIVLAFFYYTPFFPTIKNIIQTSVTISASSCLLRKESTGLYCL